MVIHDVLGMLEKRGLLRPVEVKFLQTKYQDSQELGAILIAKKIVTQEELAKIFAAALNLPFVRLTGAAIPESVLAKVPYNIASKRFIVAYEETPATLKLAIAEPYYLAKGATGPLTDLEIKAGKKIEVAVSPKVDVLQILQLYQKMLNRDKPVLVAPRSQLQVPPQSDIANIDLERMAIAPEALLKFPEEIARKYQMVVFESPDHGRFKVAAVNPRDPKIKDVLSFIGARNRVSITLYKATIDGIARAIEGYKDLPAAAAVPPKPYSTTGGLGRPTQPDVVQYSTATSEYEETDIDKLLGKTIQSIQDLRAEVTGGFIPRVVGAIFSYAVVQRASDIHLEPAKDWLGLRYRVDGQLREILKLPANLGLPITSRIKILARMKIDEKRVPQDGRFDINAAGHAIDIRAATLPTIHGEKIVLRLLDKSAAKLTLEKIGVAGAGLTALQSQVAKPWGIILATGPTGSGKTTTLYAILQKVATPSVNVITLEDPVEYEIAGVNQSQVKPRIGFSFAEGLRSVLRQDPNIIMVGEIRDRETAELATQAALTGHLVLSTLHTNDAASSLARLVNIGVEPFLITSALNAVVGQRLVRLLCEKCKVASKLPPPMEAKIRETMQGVGAFDFSRSTFYSVGQNCPDCSSGYKGRIGIFEVMVMSEQIEQATLARQPASEIDKIARREGMVTMRQDGVLKAAVGLTSLDEVWKATV